MRKWYLPMAVLGVGSVGLLMVSDAGRDAVRWLKENVLEDPDQLSSWNDAAQEELNSIKASLDQLASSLGLLKREVRAQ